MGALVPMPVKKGDLVLFAKYSGTEVKLDGEEYLVLRASDIIGVLRKRLVRPEDARMLIRCSNEGDKVHDKTTVVR